MFHNVYRNQIYLDRYKRERFFGKSEEIDYLHKVFNGIVCGSILKQKYYVDGKI